MTSKATGEPPLLASVSVLTAFQEAITAAKQGLADLQASMTNSTVSSGNSSGNEAGHQSAVSNGETHSRPDGQPLAVSNGSTESVREQVLRQLEAPVTVKEVKRVIGELQLSQLLLSHEQ